MKVDSMETLLYEELKDIYDAEKQLTKALPKLVRAAQSQELQEALKEHLDVTQEQVNRMERVFDALGQTAKSKPCEGMKGLIKEGAEALELDASEPFFDAAIIAAAQRVEHYEIAAYGTVCELAERLGNKEAAELLEESLNEEKEADQKLTEVAMALLDGADEANSEDNDRKQSGRMEHAEMPSERKRVRKAS